MDIKVEGANEETMNQVRKQIEEQKKQNPSIAPIVELNMDKKPTADPLPAFQTQISTSNTQAQPSEQTKKEPEKKPDVDANKDTPKPAKNPANDDIKI